MTPATWGPTLQQVLTTLQSDRFVGFLSELSGIEGLRRDDSLEGGGLHRSVAGGFLNVHADFTVHPRTAHGSAGPICCSTSTRTGSPNTAATWSCGAPT